tara:strand:+ start:286 stop:489 length:204 start_codon:yes stop_codon:yes gene_type:complete
MYQSVHVEGKLSGNRYNDGWSEETGRRTLSGKPLDWTRAREAEKEHSYRLYNVVIICVLVEQQMMDP